jgi:hypothetical protein
MYAPCDWSFLARSGLCDFGLEKLRGKVALLSGKSGVEREGLLRWIQFSAGQNQSISDFFFQRFVPHGFWHVTPLNF